MKILSLILLSFVILHCSQVAQTGAAQPIVTEDPIPIEDGLSRKKKFRMAIISDLNGSYGSTVYNKQVKQAVSYLVDPNNEIDFVLSTGDMVAGQKSKLDYKAMWRGFHQAVTRPLLTADIAFFPSPGNHDAYLGRKTERQHYLDTWTQEDPLSKAKNFIFVKGVEQNFPFQYAFRIGSALFMSLDNTAVQNWKPKTLKWMEDVLKQESDSQFKLIFGHVPLLPFAFKKEREYVARGSVSFLNRVESLFEKYKVDIFMSGHSHVYYPGRRGLHTEFISVPLLGSGTRYLISQKAGLARSERGFLVIEYDETGNWQLEHRAAGDFKLIEDSEFPKVIDLPSKNTSKCAHCTQFPTSHFLDARKRIIYQRRDQL